MREPTLLFGTLRPDSTGAVSPLWKGLEPPGAGPDRPSSPAAREQCSWFLHLLVGRLFQLQKSFLRWQAWVEGSNREGLATENKGEGAKAREAMLCSTRGQGKHEAAILPH